MTITKKFIEENEGKRFTVTFENGNVLKNIKLFIGTTGQIGYLQGRQKRAGSYFPIFDTIKDVTDVTKPKKVYSDVANAKTILKKIHPNAWDSLKKEMEDVIEKGGCEKDSDFHYHFTKKLNFKNITQYLSFNEQQNLKRAFENKKEYHWNRETYHHAGRDLTISVELHSDGILRAYFSSEYMGWGNGDYWLLLNPTTAIFYETD